MTRFTKLFPAAFMCAASLFLSPAITQAQISDPGFENWDSVDNGSFKNYLPAGWGDFINQSCVMENKPWAVTRTNDAHSGSYAIQLKNIALETPMAAGLMSMSGKPDEFNNKIPVTTRHTKLEGYYKYSSPGNDTFRINVLMTKGDQFVGFAEYNQTKKTDTYTKFSIPVIYTSTATQIPDSAVIIISAGSGEVFTEGTTLVLDDINFNLSSGLETPHELKAEINVWPNPASGFINLALTGELKGLVNVEIVNLLGQTIKHIQYATHRNELQDIISLDGLAKGLLFIKITDDNGSKAVRLVHQ